MRRGIATQVISWSILMAPATASAAEYWVDNAATNASDSGPGSQGEPWVNAPGMPGWTGSATLQPGDVVHFRNTGTWTADDGIALLDVAPGVTFDGSSWGDGERAILRASYDYNKSVVNFLHDHPTEPSTVRGFAINGFDIDAIAITAGRRSPRR